MADAHEDAVFTTTWTAQNQILTGSVDSAIKVWNGASLEADKTFDDHTLGIISVGANRDGNSTTTVCVWGGGKTGQGGLWLFWLSPSCCFALTRRRE